MRAALPCLALIALLVISSGCLGGAGPSAPGNGDPDADDPGPVMAVNLTYLDHTSQDMVEWDVDICGPEDYGILLVRNEGEAADTYRITVVEVSQGFKVTPERTTVQGDNTTVLPVMLTYRVDGAATGDSGSAVVAVSSTSDPGVSDMIVLNLRVSRMGEPVTRKGDKVMVSYVLTDEGGSQLDAGTLPATAGERYVGPAQRMGYIDGFYLGLLGMYRGEVKSIRVPPELAYGADPDAHQLGGQYLIFRLTLDVMIPR